MKTVPVDALCAGSIAPLPGGKRSGIAKTPLTGKVEIGLRGIPEDAQGDRRHHGFAAMALHHYPAEHYAWLREECGPLPRLRSAGSMGENMATCGLLEHDVLIGDRFRFGTAVIEATQPRQPCATIEQHLNKRGLVKKIVASGRCGWFYRVLESGTAMCGDRLVLEERGHEGWTIARVFAVVYGPSPDAAIMAKIAKLARVSDRLQRDIAKRIG